MSHLVCGHCRRRYRVRVLTDGRGGTFEEPCPCTDRRLAGVCQDCPSPVEGTIGRALRCACCKERRAREASARWRRRNPDSYRRTLSQQNRKRRSKTARARRREYERAHRSRPDIRARRLERRRQRGVEAPELKREQHRRYRERHPDRVAEQMRRANERRAAAKREYMHRYATVYVGEGKLPTCRTCSAEVPFNGRGRPKLECRSCDPRRWAQAEARRAVPC